MKLRRERELASVLLKMQLATIYLCIVINNKHWVTCYYWSYNRDGSEKPSHHIWKGEKILTRFLIYVVLPHIFKYFISSFWPDYYPATLIRGAIFSKCSIWYNLDILLKQALGGEKIVKAFVSQSQSVSYLHFLHILNVLHFKKKQHQKPNKQTPQNNPQN